MVCIVVVILAAYKGPTQLGVSCIFKTPEGDRCVSPLRGQVMTTGAPDNTNKVRKNLASYSSMTNLYKTKFEILLKKKYI